MGYSEEGWLQREGRAQEKEKERKKTKTMRKIEFLHHSTISMYDFFSYQGFENFQ